MKTTIGTPMLWVAVVGITWAAVVRSAENPNIVFILTDDQGWSDVGFTAGDEFYETPNIDRIAKEGMVFENGFSAGPNCAPTRACLVSGMYTPRHKIYTPGITCKGHPFRQKLWVPLRSGKYLMGIPRSSTPDDPFEVRGRLDPSVVSIAEVVKPQGYATARYGKWHCGPDVQGFDFSSGDGESGPEGNHYGDPDVSRRITDASLKFIRENRKEPFFLFVSYFDVHTPIRAYPEVVLKYDRKLKTFQGRFDDFAYNTTYAAMVEAADVGVGRILAELERQGLKDNTLVIFSSDNGGTTGSTHNRGLRGGKGSFYEGGVRVPMCAMWPNVIKPGSSCRSPVTSVDFLPTFAELTGAELPDSQPIDGTSIVPLLKGEDILMERPIYWHYPMYMTGKDRSNYTPFEGGKAGVGEGWRMRASSMVRVGEWKLIECFDDGSIELYNTKADPGEKSNLAGVRPEKKREMLSSLRRWQTDVAAPVPSLLNPFYGKDDEYRKKKRKGKK